MERGIFLATLALIFLFAFLAPTIIDSEITGYATADNETTNETEETTTEEEPSTIQLTTNSQQPYNSNLAGTLTLTTDDDILSTEPITLTFNDIEYTKTFLELVDYMNYTYEQKSTTTQGTNSDTSKTLTESGTIGFKVPRFSNIEELSFTLTGEEATNIEIDFGSEGATDWYYIGEFLNYKTEYIISEELDLEFEGTSLMQGDNYYCEYLTLEKSKHFKVSANYTEQTETQLKAVLLSVPTGEPTEGYSGGSDNCDFTEDGCEIELLYPIEGKYLVCIYAEDEDSETDYFSIPTDTSEDSNTGFVCPKTSTGLCTITYSSNFPIYIQSTEYNNTLTGSPTIEDWQTAPESIQTAVEYYVGEDPYAGICETDDCYVPIDITFDSGSLTFSDLTLTYEKQELEQTTTVFYDITQSTPEISKVTYQDLGNAVLEFSLGAFEVPLSTKGTFTIQANFLDNTTNVTIEVLDEADILDAESLITEATTLFSGFTDQSSNEYQVVYMLDLNTALDSRITQLESYKQQIDFLDEETLLSKIDETLESMPKEITITEGKTETQEPSLDDIPSFLNAEETYLQQDEVTVKATIYSVSVNYYDGNTETYKMVKKEISPKEDLENVYIYEVPPSTDIMYTIRPTVESSTFKYSKSELSSTETYYYMTTDASLSDFVTIISFSEEEVEEIVYEVEEESSFPTTTVIIIVIVLAVIILLVVLNLPKKKPVKSLRKANPALVNFIKRNSKKSTKELISMLKGKGWQMSQIETALRETGKF